MTSLQAKARAYYEAGGYRILREGPGFFDASNGEPRGGRVLVWVDEELRKDSGSLTSFERAERERGEADTLRAIASAMSAAPGAIGYYLARETAGFSQAFRAKVPELCNGGGLRVPVQFFDSEYKADTQKGRAARGALGEVLSDFDPKKRILQPFYRRSGLEESAREFVNADIVDEIAALLTSDKAGSRICILDGSAGGGKTVAFDTLTSRLFEGFKQAKNALHLARRPIAFLPKHLRKDKDVGYLDDILDAVIDSDVASPVSAGQLKWLLQNGFSAWMFDGLDEFYDGSPDFLPFLESVLNAPGSEARILICTRDSLLTSSPTLRKFIEDRFRARRDIAIFELAPFDATSWRRMALLETSESRAAEFVANLERSPVAALAALPFYCRVLLDRFTKDGRLPADEFALLDSIFDRMLDREYRKDLFHWQDFVDLELLSDAEAEEGRPIGRDAEDRARFEALAAKAGQSNLIELIEALAHLGRRTPGMGEAEASLRADIIREFFGEFYLSDDLDDELNKRRLTVLAQFAFFGRGSGAGTVDFTHPILADYLSARHALRMLRAERDDPRPERNLTLSELTKPASAVQQAIGTAPFDPKSLFARYLKREVDRDRSLKEFLTLVAKSGRVERANARGFLEMALS